MGNDQLAKEGWPKAGVVGTQTMFAHCPPFPSFPYRLHIRFASTRVGILPAL